MGTFNQSYFQPIIFSINQLFFLHDAFVNGGHDYESEKKNPDESKRIDRIGGWGQIGDGYHNITRYGELETDPHRRDRLVMGIFVVIFQPILIFNQSRFCHRYSLGVVMRNWHPGPMGFQLTSDAFTYVYTKALLQALDRIEEA